MVTRCVSVCKREIYFSTNTKMKQEGVLWPSSLAPADWSAVNWSAARRLYQTSGGGEWGLRGLCEKSEKEEAHCLLLWRVELQTSSMLGWRSNQLSYKSLLLFDGPLFIFTITLRCLYSAPNPNTCTWHHLYLAPPPTTAAPPGTDAIVHSCCMLIPRRKASNHFILVSIDTRIILHFINLGLSSESSVSSQFVLSHLLSSWCAFSVRYTFCSQ